MRKPIPPLRQRLADRAKAAGGLVGAGMSAAFGSRRAGTAGILFYHRIAPRITGLPEPGLNVTPDRFRLQMEGLLERGFEFVSLRLLIQLAAAGQPFPERAVVVTFDDAFAGVSRWAVPILSDLRIPATVFAVTDYVGRTVPMHFDMWGIAHHEQADPDWWRSMTWEECVEAEKTGLIEIGCHTHSHHNYSGKLDEFRADIATAQARFRENLGAPRNLFAIPYGDRRLGQVDDGLLQAAEDAGLICALTTTLGPVAPGEAPFGWRRLEVVERDNGATLAAKVEGWYDWMSTVKSAVHRVSPW
ncbi:MAG: polysaccharide deacetylase family protein [Rhodothermales bacterium]|nr:polysaccharide deacetylase family protein [Rhodothermales bacterium]